MVDPTKLPPIHVGNRIEQIKSKIDRDLGISANSEPIILAQPDSQYDAALQILQDEYDIESAEEVTSSQAVDNTGSSEEKETPQQIQEEPAEINTSPTEKQKEKIKLFQEYYKTETNMLEDGSVEIKVKNSPAVIVFNNKGELVSAKNVTGIMMKRCLFNGNSDVIGAVYDIAPDENDDKVNNFNKGTYNISTDSEGNLIVTFEKKYVKPESETDTEECKAQAVFVDENGNLINDDSETKEASVTPNTRYNYVVIHQDGSVETKEAEEERSQSVVETPETAQPTEKSETDEIQEVQESETPETSEIAEEVPKTEEVVKTEEATEVSEVQEVSESAETDKAVETLETEEVVETEEATEVSKTEEATETAETDKAEEAPETTEPTMVYNIGPFTEFCKAQGILSENSKAKIIPSKTNDNEYTIEFEDGTKIKVTCKQNDSGQDYAELSAVEGITPYEVEVLGNITKFAGISLDEFYSLNENGERIYSYTSKSDFNIGETIGEIYSNMFTITKNGEELISYRVSQHNSGFNVDYWYSLREGNNVPANLGASALSNYFDTSEMLKEINGNPYLNQNTKIERFDELEGTFNIKYNEGGLFSSQTYEITYTTPANDDGQVYQAKWTYVNKNGQWVCTYSSLKS